MRFDSLRQPVSETSPTGPDLDEEMDSDYLNYTLLASGRLPARFFEFDRSSINVDAEMEVIEGFLARTRDARLLTLAARFEALGGSIVGFSDAVQGLAIIVTTFWETFYPRESDGDFVVRQNTIEGLEDQIQVVLPLQFATIAGGARSQPVSLRSFLVASGKTPARPGEATLTPDVIAGTLSAETHREQVTTVYAAVKAAMTALDEIRKAFLAHDAAMFMPSFEKVSETLKSIFDLILANRPELGPTKAVDGEAEGAEGEAGTGAAMGSAPLTGAIKTHAAAKGALSAVERYFLTTEPSNPALILVHQARMLIGRPLVEVLQALLPDSSAKAVLRFDAGLQFDIDLTRMRSVTEHALAEAEAALAAEAEAQGSSGDGAAADDGWGKPAADSAEPGTSDISEAGPSDGAADGTDTPAGSAEDGALEPAPAAPQPPPPPGLQVKFKVASRNQASDLLASTETFFRQVEPSSSLPILLSKARGYLNRDFASILSELIPKKS